MVLIPQRPYRSWTVSESDYPQTGTSTEQGQFLVRYALLAANAYNTQPWKFLVHEHTIELIPDFSRSLPKSDPLYREFFVSLGGEAYVDAATTRHLLAIVEDAARAGVQVDVRSYVAA